MRKHGSVLEQLFVVPRCDVGRGVPLPNGRPRAVGQGPAGGDNTFPGLTALRGIAAVLVVLFHAPSWGLAAYLVSVTQLAAHGYIWVDLFFVLSGFVMAHAYGGRFIAKPRGAWRDYLAARFARLYPLHLFTLLFLALIELSRPWTFGDFYPRVGQTLSAADFSWPLFARCLLLSQGLWHAAVPWNAPAWSISCEAAVCFVFPLLYLALVRSGRRTLWAVVAACYLTLAAVVFASPAHNLSTRHTIIQCVADFSLGLCLYRLYVERRIPPFLSSDGFGFAAIGLLAVSLHLGLPDLAIVPQLCLLLVIAAVNQRRLAGFLGSRLPQFLGRISYSIYLVHWPLFYVTALILQSLWGPDVLLHQSGVVRAGIFVPALLAVIGVASLTYRLVEVPCRTAILRACTKRTRASPPVALAAAISASSLLSGAALAGPAARAATPAAD